MEKQLEELELLLSQELDLHNSLLNVTKEFNGAIKENNLDLIRKKTTEQDEHICSIERLEESRKECCKSILGQLNSTIFNAKFTYILERLPDNWKTKLMKLHASLKSVIQELTSINTSNRILLEEADRMIGKTLAYFTQSRTTLYSYSQQGKVPVKQSGFTLYNNVI
jgi:hypothetical protein